ncbi:MAG: M20/M25/M40 family metallo-hydrolase, partial [Chloroflexota bacterium]|nr:M20/M25/M40 family metallo-hydrolase [Chloroflexota bacterium]
MQQVYNYIDEHWMEAINDLETLCRQPSISAQGVGIEETVQLLEAMMQKNGISTQILHSPDGGYPFIYGEIRGESPITLLFYNHYDVQPPEPLELWSTPPFEPTHHEGKLRARGVSDDKGDIIARLLAIKAYQEALGKLPVTVKFLIEGEEEIGSPNIAAFIENNQSLLKADACIWECGGVNTRNEPTISLGLKGILYVQLEVRGASQDVHSSMSPVVPNPAWRLVWALASLKDMEETVLIEGFYDSVVPPTQKEIDVISAIPQDDEQTKQSLGLEKFVKGVTGLDYKLRHILEPACNICGLESGYTGPGSKTVLPCLAQAKLDFRLVPDQRPEDILEKLRKHLDSHGFSDVIIDPAMEGENPARTPLDAPFVDTVTRAARDVYGMEPVIIPSMAGSGPM